MFAPQLFKARRAFHGALAGEMKERHLRRAHAALAIFAVKADPFHPAAEPTKNFSRAVSFSPHTIDYADKSQVIAIEPFRVRQGDIVTSAMQKFRPQMLDHEIQI